MHPSEEIWCAKSDKLKGKRVVVGTTGSIAAVETVKLIRELIRHGAEVYPIMSQESQRIIHPTSLEFASGNKPIVDVGGDVAYINLLEGETKADLLLVAPCTANTLSKIATGISDTIVTLFATQALGLNIPMIIVPSMHIPMYKNPIISDNIKTLKKLGVEFIEPRIDESAAKLPGIDEVVAKVIRSIGKSAGSLKKNKVVVIGGATKEPIDDVRFISAYSTGGTAIELAKNAFEMGAAVELWIGRCEEELPDYLPVRRYETARELTELTRKLTCDYCLVPAAISDYAPKKAKGKISSSQKKLGLELEALPKIIDSIRKKSKCFLVGFKAEPSVPKKELISRALQRLKRGHLDMIVANDLSKVGDKKSEVIVIDKKGRWAETKGSRAEIAESIWTAVIDGVS